MKTNYTLCDYKCPLHDKCARFLESIDKTTTLHFGTDPYNYNKNKCGRFVELTEEDIMEKVKAILKPFNN